MRRPVLILLVLLVLAVPAAAQVSSWWGVFVADRAADAAYGFAGNPMILFGPYRTRQACEAQLPELRRSNPEAMRDFTGACRPALDLARMFLAP